MRVKVQLVICADDERTDTIHEVAVLEKDCQRIEQLGLTLAEAKQLLTQLQQHVVAHQATVFVTTRSHCEACGTPLREEGTDDPRLTHPLWDRAPHQSSALSLPVSATHDDHLPAVDGAPIRVHDARIALPGDEVGVVDLLWDDRPRPEGLSPGGRDPERDHRSQSHPRRGPTL